MQEVYSAAKADNAEELWTMLEATPGFDKNAKNANGNTALITAAYKGHHKAVKFLLDHGADFALRNNGGYTAMMYACYRGDKNSIKHLLIGGADPKLKENTGRSSLDLCNNSATREFLVKEIAAQRGGHDKDIVQTPPDGAAGDKESHEAAVAPDRIPSEHENSAVKEESNGNNATSCRDLGGTGYAELSKLKSECQELRNELIEAHAGYEDGILRHESTIAGLRIELRDLRVTTNNEVSAVIADMALLRAENACIEPLRETVRSLEKSIVVLSQDRDDSLKAMHSLKDQLQEAKATVERCDADISVLKTAATVLKEENAVLQREKESAEALLKDVEASLESCRNERLYLSEEVQLCTTRLSALQEAESTLKSTMFALESENANLRKTSVNSVVDAAAGPSSDSCDARSFTSDVAPASEELGTALKLIKDLEQEVAQLKLGTHSSALAGRTIPGSLSSLDAENAFASLAGEIVAAHAAQHARGVEAQIAASDSGGVTSLAYGVLNKYGDAVDLLPASFPCRSGVSDTVLRWDQVESSLLQDDVKPHLTRHQIIVIVAAVLDALDTFDLYTIDETDENFSLQVSKSIVSVLGVDKEFIFDEDGIAQIPMTFVLQTLRCFDVISPVRDDNGTSWILPALQPEGDYALELVCGRDWVPCCKLLFSNGFQTSFFNRVRNRMLEFCEPLVSHRNYTSFSTHCYDRQLTSDVLVFCDEEEYSLTVSVGGNSHVSCALVLCVVVGVWTDEYPATRSINITVDSMYREGKGRIKWPSVPKFESPCWIDGDLLWALCARKNNEGNSSPSDPMSTLQTSVGAVLQAWGNMTESFAEIDFDMLDSSIITLHFEMLRAIPVLIRSAGVPRQYICSSDSLIGDHLATLWFLCRRTIGAEKGTSGLVLLPVSPGVAPTDKWNLLPNCSVFLRDIYKELGYQTEAAAEEVVLLGMKSRVASMSILANQALEFLGVSSVPGVTVIDLLSTLSFDDSVRNTFSKLLLQRQRAHFRVVRNECGFVHCVAEVVLCMSRVAKPNIGIVTDQKKVVADEEISLSLLDEDDTLDDRAAVTKARMVGELSRRLTFHREKSRNDADDNGLVASLLKQDSGESFESQAEFSPLIGSTLCNAPTSFMLFSEEMWSSMCNGDSKNSERSDNFKLLLKHCTEISPANSLSDIKYFVGNNPTCYLIILCENCGSKAGGAYMIQGPMLCAVLALASCLSVCVSRKPESSRNLPSFNMKCLLEMKHSSKIHYLKEVAILLDQDIGEADIDILRWYQQLILDNVSRPDAETFGARTWQHELIPVFSSQYHQPKNVSTSDTSTCYVCTSCFRRMTSRKVDFANVTRTRNRIELPESRKEFGNLSCSLETDEDAATKEVQDAVKSSVVDRDCNVLPSPSSELTPAVVDPTPASEEPSNLLLPTRAPTEEPHGEQEVPVPPPHGCCVIS